MEISFAAPDLRRLDELNVDSVVVPLATDDRPPRGVCGLLDWRLRGDISNLIARGAITGELGEVTLIATEGRLPMERAFVLGMGPRSRLNGERAEALLQQALPNLLRAGVRSLAVALPGRARRHLPAEEAGLAWLRAVEQAFGERELRRGGAIGNVVLLDDVEAQRTMSQVIENEERRLRAKYSMRLEDDILPE